MSRADYRRLQKEQNKKPKTYVMTDAEIKKLRAQEFDRAKKLLMERNDELTEEIWRMMLVIPTNVLIADFWPKTAKKRIPEFLESCMSLFEAWEQGAVDMDQMQKYTEEYGKIKLVKKGTTTDRVLEEYKVSGRG